MKGFAAMVYLCLAGFAGFALFHITYKVDQLEAQLCQLNKEILLEQNIVHVLKAEWSFISRPERINELRRKMLPDLHPLQTMQIGDLDNLPIRIGQPLTLPNKAVTGRPISAQPVSAKLPE